MRCVILNRNYPPNSGITGYSASELAAYLLDHGVEVHIVTVGGNYQGGVRAESQRQTATLHYVRSIYDGKNKILRLVGSLIEGRIMAKRAASLGISPLITLTDPPLLNYWVARSCRRRQIPWIYWSMDIYPEAFVSAGLSSARSPFYRHFKKIVSQAAPCHLIALGPKQAEYLSEGDSQPVSTSILPCGVDHIQTSKVPPDWFPPGNKITFCYLGNLGQAHDPFFVETVIEALNPEKHHFILSVYGIHAARLLKFAGRFKHVTILSEVKRDELGWIDIHLASLKPAWDHVCVPSKAVSAVCAGSCLMLCASSSGDNWHLLQDAAWRIKPGPEMRDEIICLINTLSPASVSERRAKALAICQNLLRIRTNALDEILNTVTALQLNS